MDKLAEELKEELQDRRFYFLEGPVIPSFRVPNLIIGIFRRKYRKAIERQKKLFKGLENAIEKEATLFSYNKIPFAEMILQKTREVMNYYIIGLMLWSAELKQFINRSKAEAFISNGNRADDTVLAELCREKGIPAILISHGSHVNPKNDYERIEWEAHGRALLRARFSHLALQSPLAEGHLDAFPSESNIVKTGPLIWGRPVNPGKSGLLFEDMFKAKYGLGKIKVVLHAGTPKSSNASRLYVYETPDEYIRAIYELANAVQKIPDTILIVKFRPRTGFSRDILEKMVPFSEKVILSVDESFSDVLGMTDLLVSFSSTTIEEALQNRIPVLQYGGRGRYQHIPAYEIKGGSPAEPRAVYYVKEVEDLEYAINNILDLNIKRDKHLFEPYIYPKHERVSIVELLK